jgi:hypothetical protein
MVMGVPARCLARSCRSVKRLGDGVAGPEYTAVSGWFEYPRAGACSAPGWVPCSRCGGADAAAPGCEPHSGPHTSWGWPCSWRVNGKTGGCAAAGLPAAPGADSAAACQCVPRRCAAVSWSASDGRADGVHAAAAAAAAVQARPMAGDVGIPALPAAGAIINMHSCARLWLYALVDPVCCWYVGASSRLVSTPRTPEA